MRTLLCVLLLVACGCASKPKWSDVHGTPDPATRRTIANGDIVGFADSPSTHAWLGMPYAAPPVGPLRWRATTLPANWAGVREATSYGAVCPQFEGLLVGGKMGGEAVTGSEDCLTLNVSAPQLSAEQATIAKRAVMVWVHGGGNSIGTANTYGVMRNLASRYGVVVVSVNYRLGILGWFRHPSLRGADGSILDASGNFGTLDLIAALDWVHANIEQFGGDPANVTVFGESAGGFNTFSLLASPVMKAGSTMHRAIIESGVPSTTSLAEAENFTDAPDPGSPNSSSEMILKWLMADGRAADRSSAKKALAEMKPEKLAEYLRAKTPSELLAPFKGAGMGMYQAPALFRDGAVLPISTVVNVLGDPNQGTHVPVLLGTNRDEWKLFLAFNTKYVGKRLFVPFIRDEAVYDRDAALVSDTWKMLGTDWPAKALMQSQGDTVFAYRFDWDEEPTRMTVDVSKLLGAAHGMEIGFVFDDVAGEFDAFGAVSDENKAGREKLAHAMSSYWVNFAKTGAPGRGVEGALPEWKAYGDGQFMTLDSDAGGGVRLQKGEQSAEAIEAPVWSMGERHAQCEAYARLFGGFGRGAGAWTEAREASFRSHCPNENLAAILSTPAL